MTQEMSTINPNQINPRSDKFVCIKFNLPFHVGMDMLDKRQREIVHKMIDFRVDTMLDDREVDDIAYFNALINLVGAEFGRQIEFGRDAKEMWRLFSGGVQSLITLFGLEISK